MMIFVGVMIFKQKNEYVQLNVSNEVEDKNEDEIPPKKIPNLTEQFNANADILKQHSNNNIHNIEDEVLKHAYVETKGYIQDQKTTHKESSAPNYYMPVSDKTENYYTNSNFL